jgi:hypothetical protein
MQHTILFLPGQQSSGDQPGGLTQASMETLMAKQFDTPQFATAYAERIVGAQASAAKAAQALATEAADYAKKALAEGTAALEQLVTVRSLDKAIEIQTAYAKASYEGFVAQTKKVGELYAGFAKEAFRPFAAA